MSKIQKKQKKTVQKWKLPFSFISKAITKCDLNEDGLTMTFNKKSRHKTTFGGVMSLIILGFFIFIIIQFIPSFKSTGNINVSSSIQYSESTPIVNLLENNFYPIVYLTKNGKYIDVDDMIKYVIMVSAVITVDYDEMSDFSNNNFRDKLRVDFDPFLYIQCKRVDTKAKTWLYNADPRFQKIGDKHGYCMRDTDEKDIIIHGEKHDPPFKFFNYQLVPCYVDPDIGNTCVPSEELDDVEIHFIILEYSFDPDNKENPVSVYPVTQLKLQLNRFWKKQITAELKLNEIYDTEDVFKTLKLRASYVDIDKTKEQTIRRNPDQPECQPTGCDNLINFVFLMKKKKKVVIRRFPVPLGILSEIGSLIETLEIITIFIYLLVFHRISRNAIQKLVLGEDKTEDAFRSKKEKYREKRKLLSKLTSGINLTRQLLFVEVMSDVLMLEQQIEDSPLKELITLDLLKSFKNKQLKIRKENNHSAAKILQISKSFEDIITYKQGQGPGEIVETQEELIIKSTPIPGRPRILFSKKKPKSNKFKNRS